MEKGVLVLEKTSVRVSFKNHAMYFAMLQIKALLVI